MSTWANSQDMAKIIDFLFISLNLVNAVVDRKVSNVGEFFDTDYHAVFVSVDLGGLLNKQLNSLCKQANRDWALIMYSPKNLQDFTNWSSWSLELLEPYVRKEVVDSGAGFSHVHSVLFGARKYYRAAKLAKSLRAKKANIRSAIDRWIESFEMNKSHIIKSVLEHPFHKVVLDHLVVNDKLILEPDLTSKHGVIADVSDVWSCQYWSLDYVFDEVFSGVMHLVEFSELFNKHCDKLILDMFLVLLNFCLSCESVSRFWKKAWVLMIPKSYEWEGVFTNTCSIALIEMACKIFSKILSNRISLAYSIFDVFHEDNFSVLKSMTTQSPIFAIGSVVEDEYLKKSLIRIKMCSKFIWFFGGIYRDHTNRVMTDFVLTDGYHIHNGLDQRERQKSMCGYRLSSYFISRNGHAESQTGLSSFFAAGAFIDDTIWLNLAKTNLDVCFFTNLILRKAVSDKQFLYLVLAVFYPIVNYRTQFSFIPSESKVASLVSFANLGGILSHLFSHRFHDLQVLYWCSAYSLSSPVHIHVSASDNFLAGMVYVLLDCNLFLDGSLANSFQFRSGVPMSVYDIVFVDQLRDHHGFFKLFVAFLDGKDFSLTYPSVLDGIGSLNIFESNDFASVCDCLSQVGANSLLVYTDGSFSNLSTVGCRTGAATFFEDIDLGLDIGMSSLMSSTLAELQAIALALKSILLLNSVKLFLNSQFVLNAYKSELGLTVLDFRNQCWVECCHIVNVIHSKNLKISWHKVKSHSDVSGNEHANAIASNTSLSSWYLPLCVDEHFIMAGGSVVSSNFRHFVCDIYYLVCCVHWEIGSGFKFLANGLLSEVDWLCFSLVWHSDLHMAAGFTSRLLANAHTYFMKALYHQLPVVIWKCLYNRLYLSVLCLYCDNVEISNYMFSYKIDDSSFIFNDWFCKVVTVFQDSKVAGLEIVKFVCFFSLDFRSNVWSVHAKHRVFIEKNGLILLSDSIPISVFGLVSGLLAGMVKLLGIANAFGIHFGFRKSCLFFSDVSDSVSVHIAA
ncbi:hypothetical protein G9A89_023335 [Geosiphon pyriformis]|nr:hypothetical protein G9A89_023335 [Geosiphon pyriformis]